MHVVIFSTINEIFVHYSNFNYSLIPYLNNSYHTTAVVTKTKFHLKRHNVCYRRPNILENVMTVWFFNYYCILPLLLSTNGCFISKIQKIISAKVKTHFVVVLVVFSSVLFVASCCFLLHNNRR